MAARWHVSTATTGTFLLGCLVGACGVFVLSGLAIWFVDVRRAVSEGPLRGDEMERNRKRGES